MSDAGDERLFDPPATSAARPLGPATGRPLTHADLVLRAARWLTKSRSCKTVLLEPGYGSPSEIPDAIGWTVRASVVVECKATRKDFLNERRKPARRRERPGGAEDAGLGDERWYMTPPGLVRPEEVPEGWGLLEVRGGRVFRKVQAPARAPHAHVLLRERRLLVSCMSAVQRRASGLELLPSRHLTRNLGAD